MSGKGVEQPTWMADRCGESAFSLSGVAALRSSADPGTPMFSRRAAVQRMPHMVSAPEAPAPCWARTAEVIMPASDVRTVALPGVPVAPLVGRWPKGEVAGMSRRKRPASPASTPSSWAWLAPCAALPWCRRPARSSSEVTGQEASGSLCTAMLPSRRRSASTVEATAGVGVRMACS